MTDKREVPSAQKSQEDSVASVSTEGSLSVHSDSNGADTAVGGAPLSQEIDSKLASVPQSALASVPQSALASRLARRDRASFDNVALMALEPQSHSQRGYITAKELRSSRKRLLDLFVSSERALEREHSQSTSERARKE